MIRLLALLVGLFILSPVLVSCSTDNPEPTPQTGQTPKPNPPENNEENGENGEENDNNNSMSNNLSIRVGNATFRLTLESSATTTAFKALLPLTLNMSEHNGNEKFDYLSTNLPTSASRPGAIQTGDLMLFGSNCLVLFYESFSSSYSYTRLGRVDNPSGLAAALGRGSATVKFEIATN